MIYNQVNGPALHALTDLYCDLRDGSKISSRSFYTQLYAVIS